MHRIIEIHITFPNEAVAQEICHLLIVEKLAACVNLFPVQSMYHWQSQLQKEEEWASALKTISEKVVVLIDRVIALHPYQVPAITWMEVESTPQYADWVKESVSN